mmetsp:Transcript_162165/g.520052  ORF Transcript_162165/g.520052 Transcript_162165/m.520052 type:complete len:211 (-) Transcript_162165:108-740(-)
MLCRCIFGLVEAHQELRSCLADQTSYRAPQHGCQFLAAAGGPLAPGRGGRRQRCVREVAPALAPGGRVPAERMRMLGGARRVQPEMAPADRRNELDAVLIHPRLDGCRCRQLVVVEELRPIGIAEELWIGKGLKVLHTATGSWREGIAVAADEPHFRQPGRGRPQRLDHRGPGLPGSLLAQLRLRLEQATAQNRIRRGSVSINAFLRRKC